MGPVALPWLQEDALREDALRFGVGRGATGSAWPPGAMAALAVVFLLLWAASWPSASASGEEFWPGQSAADILSGAASRRR